MKRREFMIAGGGLLSLTVLSGYALKPEKSLTLVAGHSNGKPDAVKQGYYRKSNVIPGSLVFFDTRTSRGESYKFPFYPHGFGFAKSQPWLGTSYKWGNQAAIFDHRSRKLVQLLEAPADQTFFGHCEFLDNDRVFALSGQGKKLNGVIYLFDTRNWKLLEQIEVGAASLHDIQSISASELMFPAQGQAGGESGTDAVLIYDWRTRQVKKRLPAVFGAHIHRLNESKVFVGGFEGLTKPSKIYFGDWNENKFVTLPTDVQKLLGEALSLQGLNSDSAIISLPDANRLLAWNGKESAFVLATTQFTPRAIAPYGNNRFLVNGRDNSLREWAFDPIAKELKEIRKLSANFANGSHMAIVPSI